MIEMVNLRETGEREALRAMLEQAIRMSETLLADNTKLIAENNRLRERLRESAPRARRA